MRIDEKILNSPIFRQDRMVHFAFGFLIFLMLTLFFSTVGAAIIVAIIAGAKELIYDMLIKKEKPEFLDWLYSILPSILIILI